MTDITKFLDDHGGSLFRLLYRVTLREDVAEDLLQELFLKLRGAAAFRTSDYPVAYARRTALHLAFDWRRKRHESVSAEFTCDDIVDDRPSPLETMIKTEELCTVLDAMTALSTWNRELLTFRYIEQQSYETLAQDYGKTPHQIRALCHKARIQLRELLSERSHGTGQREKP